MEAAMSTLRSAVAHGVWDRLDNAPPDVLVAIWHSKDDDRVHVKFDTWDIRQIVDGEVRHVPCSTRSLVSLRIASTRAEDGVFLYEVPIEDFDNGLPGCHAIVGLLAVRKDSDTVAIAEVSVHISPQGGAVEDTVLTVDPSDEVVPIWRGYTILPVINVCINKVQLRRLDHNDALGVRVLCAQFMTKSYYAMKLTPVVCLECGEILATQNVNATPIVLPYIHDTHSEERTKLRTRAFEKELIEAVWHPRRVTARMEMLDM